MRLLRTSSSSRPRLFRFVLLVAWVVSPCQYSYESFNIINMLAQVVERNELIWFGRPPDESQLGDHDEELAAQVRERQADAYKMLADMVDTMNTMLAEMERWKPSSFGPASYQGAHDYNNCLSQFKECAERHIRVEVTMIIKTHDSHVAYLLRDVKLIIATADAANKLFANLVVGPAKSLRNMCDIDLAVLDEGQRCDVMPAAALLNNVKTSILIADVHQRIEPDKTYAHHNPWERPGAAGVLRNPEPQGITDMIVQRDIAHHTRLTLCKRCGPLVTGFCRRVFPFLSDFRSHPNAPQTELRFNFFSGDGAWWPATAMPSGAGASAGEVGWHNALFYNLAWTVLLQLVALESEPGAITRWDPCEMVVLVVCYLHRVLRPLSVYLAEFIQGCKLQGILRFTFATNVKVCIVDSMTGPTSQISHIIRHRRVVTAADQHKGHQADPRRFYVALTRARRSTTVWLEKEPFGTPVRRAPAVSRAEHANDAAAQESFDKMFDAIQELNIPWSDIPEWDPLQGGRRPGCCQHLTAYCDDGVVGTVVTHCVEAWTEAAPSKTQESEWGNLGKFLEDASGPNAEVNAFVSESLREVRRGGIDAAGAAAPLAFSQARPDICRMHEAVGANSIEDAIALGRKIVNGIVVTQVGNTGLQISVPTVTACGLQDFLGGMEGEPMIRAFMTVVWALHESTADDKIRLIQTAHAHKTEECHFESLHWWSRSCNSDREASVLVAPDAAAKRKRQCYAYLGGGQLSVASTTLLHTIVVKVKTWHMGACVIAACTLLNRASDDSHRVDPGNTELFIAADDAMEDEGMLEAMLMDDEGDGAPPLPQLHSKAIEFGALCEAVTVKSAAAVGLSWPAESCGFDAAEIWRRWAAQTASLAPAETGSADQQQRGGCQPARGRQLGGWQPSGWQRGGGWQHGGGWHGGGWQTGGGRGGSRRSWE